MTAHRKKGVDYCESCKGESLFSGYFDDDDLATDAAGATWKTFCNDCGHEQKASSDRRRNLSPDQFK